MEKEKNYASLVNDRLEIKKSLLSLPDKMMEVENKILSINKKIEERKQKKKEIEMQITKDVHGEKLENKPVYTNAELREIEVYKRLKDNAPYQALQDEENEDFKKQQEAKIEFDYMRRTLRSLGYIAQIITIEV